MRKKRDKNHEDEEPGFDVSVFLGQIRCLARHYMHRFFRSEGVPAVDPDCLTDDHYIDLVLDLEVEQGVPILYKALGVRYSSEERSEFKKFGTIPRDVQQVIDLYDWCASLGVPKCFASGILIMYLELCEGHDLVERQTSANQG